MSDPPTPALPPDAIGEEFRAGAKTYAKPGPIDPVTGQGQGFLPITVTPDVGIGNPFLVGGGSRNIQFAALLTV